VCSDTAEEVENLVVYIGNAIDFSARHRVIETVVNCEGMTHSKNSLRTYCIEGGRLQRSDADWGLGKEV
jgi:hypothetical protein